MLKIDALYRLSYINTSSSAEKDPNTLIKTLYLTPTSTGNSQFPSLSSVLTKYFSWFLSATALTSKSFFFQYYLFSGLQQCLKDTSRYTNQVWNSPCSLRPYNVNRQNRWRMRKETEAWHQTCLKWHSRYWQSWEQSSYVGGTEVPFHAVWLV